MCDTIDMASNLIVFCWKLTCVFLKTSFGPSVSDVLPLCLHVLGMQKKRAYKAIMHRTRFSGEVSPGLLMA